MTNFILVRISLFICPFSYINNKIFMKDMITDYFSINVVNCRPIFVDLGLRVRMNADKNFIDFGWVI